MIASRHVAPCIRNSTGYLSKRISGRCHQRSVAERSLNGWFLSQTCLCRVDIPNSQQSANNQRLFFECCPACSRNHQKDSIVLMTKGITTSIGTLCLTASAVAMPKNKLPCSFDCRASPCLGKPYPTKSVGTRITSRSKSST